MNLHGIVGPLVSAVNPATLCYIRRSEGSFTKPDGTRVAKFSDPIPVRCQIQSMQYNDLYQLDGLNIQGLKRKIYMNGHWEGLVRTDRKGGDLIEMPDSSFWLVVLVLEHWPQWTSVAVTLQDDPKQCPEPEFVR
jgi:hypothetical protein